MKMLILSVLVATCIFAIDVDLNSNVTEVKESIKNRMFNIDGRFIHYANGAYDWIYIQNSSNRIYKLDGYTEDGYLIWKEINISDLDIVDIGENIIFVEKQSTWAYTK